MKNGDSVYTHSRYEVTDFGFAMVRPDGLELSLDEEIINRIESSNLDVVKRKIFKLSDVQVDKIYCDLKDRDFYPDFKQSLVGKFVMGLLVGGTVNVNDRLMDIKGSVWDNAGTVRGDYSLAHLLDGTSLALFKSGQLHEKHLPCDAASSIMRYDRMHCEESCNGTQKAINAVFTDDEVREASGRFPCLPTFLNSEQLASDESLSIERLS